MHVAPSTPARPQCGQLITNIGGLEAIAFVEPEGAQMLWMSAGGDDLRADFCTPTVLLWSEERGREWGRRQAGNGQLLLLATAAADGRQRWAGCARAARRLEQAQ